MICNNNYHVLHFRQYCLAYSLPVYWVTITAGTRRTSLPCYFQFALESIHTKVRLGILVRLGSGGTFDAFPYWRTKFSHSVSTHHNPIVQKEDKCFNDILEFCL